MTTNLLDLELHRQLGAWVYKPILKQPFWDVSLDYFLLLLDPCYFSQPRDLQDKFNFKSQIYCSQFMLSTQLIILNYSIKSRRAVSISPHSGNRTSKAVVCMRVHAHAKVAFLRHLSRLFASAISWSRDQQDKCHIKFHLLSFLYKQTSPFSYVACRKQHLFYTVQQRKSEMSECRLDQVSEKVFPFFL